MMIEPVSMYWTRQPASTEETLSVGKLQATWQDFGRKYNWGQDSGDSGHGNERTY
jgi:hypothetical protein